jgi:gluconokinase
MNVALVIMGVAGCGKSSVAQAVAADMGLALIEGDDFHGPASLAKMRLGVPLTDADRAGWLTALAAQLQSHDSGVVMTCSALKRRYRERLRDAAPGLRFVHLEVDRATAQARVTARGAAHFFSSALVESQFTALESPAGEVGVLTLAATAPCHQLCQAVRAWCLSPTTTA